jgi:endonuclease YncB( thermonuclease family)
MEGEVIATSSLWRYRAELERVVDGDTFDLSVTLWSWKAPFPFGAFQHGSELDLGFRVYLGAAVENGSFLIHLRMRERFRLQGIDTPEKYGSRASDEGRAASSWVEEQLPVGAPLWIETSKGKGKYGRWLAVVWDTGGDEVDPHALEWADSFNQRLVDEGHAKPYPGR